MKLLKLSVAIFLVSSCAAMTPEEFIQDPQVKSLAPSLVDEMAAQGLEAYDDVSQDLPSQLSSGIKLPLLNDIVKVISLNIFNGGDADWSRLEQAKLKATQEQGAETMALAANLTEVDTRRAALIVDTIYDTVINLPPPSKDTYKAIKKKKNAQGEEEEEEEGDGRERKEDGDSEETNESNPPSALWDYLGIGLIKSSNTVKKVKGMVNPANICETTDTAYLKGVDDVVYYSSLTHGFAGGALVSAPDNSTIKSLDLQTIVSAIGKLAIELHMAQNVARLAELNPADPPVRAMTYLALTSDSSLSSSAQMARDIHNLVNQGIANNIPTSVLRALVDQASLQLVTRGARAGLGTGPVIFNNIPIIRNLFAFSTDVLNANSIGDVLKYVFCPEVTLSPMTEPSETEEAGEKIQEAAEKVVEKGREAGQKVFKVSEDTAKNVAEEVKEKAKDTKEKLGKAAENMAEGVKDAKDETVAKASEAGSKIKGKAEDVGAKVQEKVLEGTVKVNEAGEKVVQEAKDTAAEAKKKAKDAAEAVEETLEEGKEAVKKKAQDMGEAASKKVEDVEQKAQEVKQKAGEKVEELKQEL
ncbi:hypothetical protein B0O80DRAFT_445700 [Mortierella sp. GBAus27b]|nr:hypothetical protein BGX31_009878 [Mortierella sp. GBA43]KAI8357734.1 hypothetical protein B0O80DRAFT_445700 [Mortierella sp. GBAus27b]